MELIGGDAVGKAYSNTRGAAAGGAGSGGGSINIFMEEIIQLPEGKNISSYINVAGGFGGNGSGAAFNASGGAGGTGSCNIGYITTGTYQSYYSNN